MTMQLLLGADPEVFVHRNGEFQSAYGLIPGTKKRPHNVDNGAVQVDGMALEFNIKPAANKDSFTSNIQSLLQQLQTLIPSDYKLSNQSVVQFDPSFLVTQPKEAIILGCDPDYNAYSHEVNPTPDQNKCLRTAAGHIHIGWGQRFRRTQGHMQACASITRQLDFFVGVPSVLLDKEDRRRELYGKAGTFRPKPYGVEYRVLSNFWVFEKSLIEYIYEQTQLAFNVLVDGKTNLFKQKGPIAKEIIDNNDRDGAKQLMKYFAWRLP